MNPHLERALVLLEQSRHDLAEKELRQALSADPDNALAHAFLSRCLCQREELNGATEEAQAAIRLDPQMPLAYRALAEALDQRNRMDEAEAAAREALRLDPADPSLHALLAALVFQQKRWEEALTQAEQGLELDAEHVGCQNLRAMALRQLGRMDEASLTMAEALSHDPDNAFSHANLGWNCLHQRQHDKALEHFREALRIDPTLDFARAGLVEALKARYWLYGIMLRYFLWMSRLSPSVQWGIVLGGLIGINVLSGFGDKNPTWKPWITPILVFYFAFVVLTWVAVPLFNLLLRLNRFGRHALTDDNRRASSSVGALFALALGCLVYWLITDNEWSFLGLVFFGLLMLPVAAAFACDRGWPRNAMFGYTFAVASLVPLALLFDKSRPQLAILCMQGFGLGCGLSGIVGNILAAQTVRK